MASGRYPTGCGKAAHRRRGRRAETGQNEVGTRADRLDCLVDVAGGVGRFEVVARDACLRIGSLRNGPEQAPIPRRSADVILGAATEEGVRHVEQEFGAHPDADAGRMR